MIFILFIYFFFTAVAAAAATAAAAVLYCCLQFRCVLTRSPRIQFICSFCFNGLKTKKRTKRASYAFEIVYVNEKNEEKKERRKDHLDLYTVYILLL